MANIYEVRGEEFRKEWKDLTKFLGVWLKETREAKDIPQKDLAEYIGISPVTLSRMENGLLKPSVKALIGYSQVTGTSLNDIIGMYNSKINGIPTTENSLQFKILQHFVMQTDFSNLDLLSFRQEVKAWSERAQKAVSALNEFKEMCDKIEDAYANSKSFNKDK